MRFLRRKNLRRDEEGVASTVGTIMALLVALTFLSLIVNQYVPVWHKDSEATHMSTALGQFGTIKNSVDTQVLSAQAAAASGYSYVPVETFTTVSMGVDGVPIFSNPTIGRLSGASDTAPWRVQFTYAIDGTTYEVDQRVAGNLLLQVDARYNVPFALSYEGGAVIMQQSQGDVIRADPQFTVHNTTQGKEMGLTLVGLIGSGNAAGSGSEGVRTKLIGLDFQEYTGFRSSLVLNHTTRFGPAWYHHFNETLALAFGVLDSDFEDPDFNYTENPNGTGQEVTTPHYRLSRVQDGETHRVSLELIYDPTAGENLAKLTLSVAYVSVAIGRSGETLGV